MFLPIRTDRRLRKTPWINYALIAVNILVFMTMGNAPVIRYMLDPGALRPIQFLTYMFLHADAMHLLGNMLFLYVFGNNVEDRLGRIGYLIFYLIGGALAGLGHVLVEPAPVLGASGAVAAVSGAFLALFPGARVTVVYWIIIIGAFEVFGIWIILFYFIFDVVKWAFDVDRVAYLAHITGYVYGFVIAIGLLLLHVLPREPYDLLSWISHRRRSRQYRKLADKGYQPWDINPVKDPIRAAEAVKLTEQDEKLLGMRHAITQSIAQQQLHEASDKYIELLEFDSSQVLPRDQQLDIGNQLAGDGRHLMAAQAYELFLQAFPKDHDRDQVELMLGLLCVRYLDRKQRGRELLQAALKTLRDPAHVDLARAALAQIDAH